VSSASIRGGEELDEAGRGVVSGMPIYGRHSERAAQARRTGWRRGRHDRWHVLVLALMPAPSKSIWISPITALSWFPLIGYLLKNSICVVQRPHWRFPAKPKSLPSKLR